MNDTHRIPKALRQRVTNQAKHRADRIAALDPQTGEIVRIFNPRHQNWSEHFAWNDSADRILGMTPTGRATVIALNLNRATLVRARQLWVRVGWHPPMD